MGFWGYRLYENDCACDVRDCYVQLIREKSEDEISYEALVQYFGDYINTAEEPLLWYALADTQWDYGRLMPEVKAKAMFWIGRRGGSEYWEAIPNAGKKWEQILIKLSDKMNARQPRKKNVENPRDYQYNPGKTGDVFAYRFHTTTAKEMGCDGHYIFMQKIGQVVNSGDLVCPVFVFFDKLFDGIDTNVVLNDIRILPFDVPHRFMPNGRNAAFPELNLCAVLDLYKKKNSPGKYMSYVGNFPICHAAKPLNMQSEFGWDCIERTALSYHNEWKEYVYQFTDNGAVVTRI